MQKNRTNYASSKNHQILQSSTTLNRRYVKKPHTNNIKNSTASLALARRQRIAEQINREKLSSMHRGYLAELTPKTSTQISVSTPLSKTSPVKPVTVKELPTHSSGRPKSIEPQSRSTSSADCPAKTKLTTPISHPIQKAVAQKQALEKAKSTYPSAQFLKNQAIDQAIKATELSNSSIDAKSYFKKSKDISTSLSKKRTFFHGKRAALALFCASLSIIFLGYFVHLKFPSISARVAAIQSGFNIVYPSFIPQDFQLTGVSAEKNQKVSLHFAKANQTITIIEEKSTWDSQALLNNFVSKEWQDNYTTSREQGITIYFSNNSAVWVNGGILYKIITSGGIDRIDLRNIVYSL